MYSDIRKQLKTVDITCYDSQISVFSDRLGLRNLKKGTLQNFISCLKIFLAWCVMFLSSKGVEHISYDDFRSFVHFLNQEHLEPRTINVYIAMLKQFRYLIQGEAWNRYELRFMKYELKLPRVPSVEEAGSMIKNCLCCVERLLLLLLFSTGLRISEAAALTFGDIRRDKHLIYIRPGKGRSDRYVPLLDDVLSALTDYYQEIARACYNAGISRPGPCDPIFRFSDYLRPANSNFLRRIYNNVVNRTFGAKGVYTPHSCRHFFALQIYLQKGDLLLVKELLGHRSLGATEVYLRLAAAQKLESDGYVNPLLLCLGIQNNGN